MSAWFVPPIVVPAFVFLIVAALAVFRPFA